MMRKQGSYKLHPGVFCDEVYISSIHFAQDSKDEGKGAMAASQYYGAFD